jgi:putative transposase
MGTSKTIGSIIRGFKIGVTKWFRQKSPDFVVWQRNYYERVIRGEKELFEMRQYIINNPANWEMDENYFRRGK